MRKNVGRGPTVGRGFVVLLGALLAAGVLASPASAEVPGTPSQPGVSPGNGQITVTFTAPATDGGKPITSYTASCAPINSHIGIFAQKSNTGEVAPIVVTGLTNGAGYTCSVHAANADGASNESFNSAVVFVGRARDAGPAGCHRRPRA